MRTDWEQLAEGGAGKGIITLCEFNIIDLDCPVVSAMFKLHKAL